ncbi:MAG: sigma-54-dependent Fis family transcriptional regulator [Pirellulales bacterium]|nr:sigma-54-dependent Fis family transcriptional regulator [Pirellulales bacterium]
MSAKSSPNNPDNASTDGPPVEVLIVDNDESHAETVADSLERVGFHCHVATSGTDGAKRLEEGAFDVVVTDLVMNDIDGLEILARAKETQPGCEVILMTGHGTVPSAVEAMQKGAFNYLLKPLSLDQLRAIAEKAAESSSLRRANEELQRRLDEKFGFEGVIGTSPQMRDVIQRLQRIAPTNATVLIQGETGTGKELVAQSIHQNSPRKNKPFVALNCAALSENILESELFGHVKGAFTDASTDRVGKFEYAHGGTMFLDEVGDMPMPTQIKLLRVLENGEITRVGSNDPVKVNVRVLSATNRNLEDAIEAGTFRSDLYHRLKVVTLRLPTLVERSQDMPMLIDHFVKLFAGEHGKRIKGVSLAARRTLLAYDWPGNVRQLRNVIESMVVVDYDGLLDVDDLPEELADPSTPPDTSPSASLSALVGQPLAEIERRFIAETLNMTGGNREEAAAMLGIGERTLYRKIKGGLGIGD